MIHGSCGNLNLNSPCIIDGKCSRHYPNRFIKKYFFDDDHRPIYCRWDDGRVIKIRNFDIYNRWIVPYNINLVKYDAHITMELCTNGRTIKYLYKYVHKGFDHAHFL